MFIRTFAAAAAALTLAPAFAQNTINWDTARAVIGGKKTAGGITETICQKDSDTFLIGNGDQLTVILTGLGVNLPSGDSALTAKANCSLVVPVEAARGRYAAYLEQTVNYGLVKGVSSSVNVSVASTFFGYRVNPLSRLYSAGSVQNIPLASAYRRDAFLVDTNPISWYYRWCGIRPKGNYTANLAVGIEKRDMYDDVQASIDGLDVRFTVAPGNFVSCSAP
jgi:hypothetical protein